MRVVLLFQIIHDSRSHGKRIHQRMDPGIQNVVPCKILNVLIRPLQQAFSCSLSRSLSTWVQQAYILKVTNLMRRISQCNNDPCLCRQKSQMKDNQSGPCSQQVSKVHHDLLRSFFSLIDEHTARSSSTRQWFNASVSIQNLVEALPLRQNRIGSRGTIGSFATDIRPLQDEHAYC